MNFSAGKQVAAVVKASSFVDNCLYRKIKDSNEFYSRVTGQPFMFRHHFAGTALKLPRWIGRDSRELVFSGKGRQIISR
ncbi:MAG: hypothetical protein D3904_10875 [Candidatus Electrothrix sp. EH2]|nr:hypothetical protein [Candidatus Electrothrix sp. EH2]